MGGATLTIAAHMAVISCALSRMIFDAMKNEALLDKRIIHLKSLQKLFYKICNG